MILDRDKLAKDLASIYVRTMFQEIMSDEEIKKMTNKKCKIYREAYNVLANMEEKAYDFSDTAEFLKKYYASHKDRSVD